MDWSSRGPGFYPHMDISFLLNIFGLLVWGHIGNFANFAFK